MDMKRSPWYRGRKSKDEFVSKPKYRQKKRYYKEKLQKQRQKCQEIVEFHQSVSQNLQMELVKIKKEKQDLQDKLNMVESYVELSETMNKK